MDILKWNIKTVEMCENSKITGTRCSGWVGKTSGRYGSGRVPKVFRNTRLSGFARILRFSRIIKLYKIEYEAEIITKYA